MKKEYMKKFIFYVNLIIGFLARKKFIFYVNLIIGFLLLLLLFFIFLYNNESRLIFGGIFYILLSVLSFIDFKKYEKKFSPRGISSTFIFFMLGALSISLYFDPNLSVVFMLILFVLGLFLIVDFEKDLPFFSFLITLLYIIFSYFLFYPFIKDITSILFVRSFEWHYFFYLFMVPVIIFSSIFFFIRQVIRIFSKRSKNISKIDNIYFITSLTLILVIIFSGTMITREIYIEDYPFDINIENFGKLSDCSSRQENSYFVAEDSIECNLIVEIENVTESNTIDSYIEVKKKNFWAFQEYLQDDPGYPYLLRIRETEGNIQFRISDEVEQYRVVIFHDYPEESDRRRYASEKISINPLSSSDARNNKVDRLLWLVAIFSAAIFSVFSAMRSLQEMLKQAASSPKHF